MATPLNNSLLKGFEVLALVTRDRPDLTAAILMADLGMNAATAHRFLTTLEEAGALAPVRRGTYRLSPRLTDLGRLAEETNPLPQQVQPQIEALAAALGESVMLCRPGRRGPVSIAVATAPRPFAMGFRVGTTVSLAQSAQGRLCLADMTPPERERALRAADADPGLLAALTPALDRIRATGLAHNEGTAEPDIGAIAAPVRDRRGQIALTLSVFGPLARFAADFRARAAGPLLATAEGIAARLG